MVTGSSTIPALLRSGKGRANGAALIHLAAVWDREIVPMLLVAPGLRPIAILEEILRRHPEIDPGVRLTLERRIRHWRALNGPEGEVIFRQRPVPARVIELHRHGRSRRLDRW